MAMISVKRLQFSREMSTHNNFFFISQFLIIFVTFSYLLLIYTLLISIITDTFI